MSTPENIPLEEKENPNTENIELMPIRQKRQDSYAYYRGESSIPPMPDVYSQQAADEMRRYNVEQSGGATTLNMPTRFREAFENQQEG